MTGTPEVPADAVDAVERAAAASAPLRRQHRWRSLAGMIVQVLLISVGVFLGLAGEEWREDRENRRLAEDSLRRFRAEIIVNRDTVNRVKDYHAERLEELNAYFAAPPETRANVSVRFAGLRPPVFAQSAWDLAFATQSLAHIDAELAFALASAYGYQAVANDLGHSVMQTMYAQPPGETDSNFFATVRLYYDDLSGIEPKLLQDYDVLVKAIDTELAE